MSTDWKALCEELANTLERAQKALRFEGGCSDATDSKRRALITRARAALAQPEPEVVGPTYEELFRIASDCAALYIADDRDYDNCSEVMAAMRAAIAADRARYGVRQEVVK